VVEASELDGASPARHGGQGHEESLGLRGIGKWLTEDVFFRERGERKMYLSG